MSKTTNKFVPGCCCTNDCATNPVCFGLYDFCDINKPIPVITAIYGAVITIYNVPSLTFTPTSIGTGTPPIAYATVSGGAVTGITILDGGCCYSAAPTIAFSGGGGTGATATATIGTQVIQSLVFTGSVTSITVANGGSGYSSSAPPTVFLTAPLVSPTSVQATATATVNTSGVVTAIAVTNAGAGYPSPPTVIIAFPSSQALTGTVTLAGGGVSAIAVTTGGSGYIVAPTVSIFGGGGTGAAATATMSSGVVTGISISAAGTGYTSAPSVLISSPNITASGTATLTGAAVSSIAVANGGAGYKVAPLVTITGGGGTGAHATASIASGAVTSFTITAGGSGYTSAPTVVIVPPETLATATAHVSNGLGSGYTSDPTLSFSGGGGSGAKAVPYHDPTSHGLFALNLIDPGTGYTSVPSVSISGGGGTGATATAVLSGAPVTAIAVTAGGSGYASSGTVGNCTVTGMVTGVTVTNGGTGYTSPPTVTFTSSSGSGAAATATLGGNSVLGFSNVYPTTGAGYSGTVTVTFTGGGGFGATGVGVLGGGGVLTSVTITNAGSGYSGIPTVGFSGGGGSGASGIATVNTITGHVTGVHFSTTGGGYITGPAVTISGGGGTGATAHTLINGAGAVSDVILDMGGSGYTSLPTVSFSGGGGSGASVTPILANDGHVATVVVTSGGSGYLTPPTVSFSGGGGTSAAATAVLTPSCCITIPAAGTYILKVTKDPHYVPLVISIALNCPSMETILLVPRPTFTVTAPSSCDPSTDETPTVTILNGSTVVASGPAGTPFVDKVTPGITYTISGTEDSAYPWYQWLVKSYMVTGCVRPSYVLNPEGVTLFPLFKSDHSTYFCFCFVPEPILPTFTLTDNWLDITCMLSPAAGAGVPNTLYNGCTGGFLTAGGTVTSVVLPYIASFTVTNGGSGYTSGAKAVLSGGGVGGGSNDRNGNPVVYPPTTVNIGGAGHNVVSVVLTIPLNVGNGFVTAPTVTITGNPAIIGGPPIGSGATATANLLVGDVIYGLNDGDCYVYCDYAGVHCCFVPLISNSLVDVSDFTVTFGDTTTSGSPTFCTHAYGIGGSTITLMP